ncbi:MAG: N-acetyltransferase [Elusimicrobiota bacterium]
MDEGIVENKVKVKQVKSKKEFKQFINLPEKIYKDDKNWVPKLDMEIKHLLGDKNPFFEHAWKKLFLAYHDGKTVGRIAAIIDYNYVDFQEEKTGFFGFFDCIKDKKIAGDLFKTCEQELFKKGMKKVIGPMNPSSNDECGILVKGFDSSPRIMMTYNKKYYIDLLESNGYHKAKDLLAFNMQVQQGPLNRLEKIVDRIKKKSPDMYSRSANLKKFDLEVKNVREVYNQAWEKNWGFVPWTENEIKDLAKQLKPLVIPELLQIGFCGEEPIGFSLALPDYNQAVKKVGRKLLPFGWLKFLYYKNKIKDLRLLAMGVKKQYQNKGIGPIMYYNSLVEAMKKGYRECEYSWILEDNIETIKIGKMMGGEIYKTYRIYEKELS